MLYSSSFWGLPYRTLQELHIEVAFRFTREVAEGKTPKGCFDPVRLGPRSSSGIRGNSWYERLTFGIIASDCFRWPLTQHGTKEEEEEMSASMFL